MEQTNPASPWHPYVWVDPEWMVGEPCFRGTRLPVRILFEYLSDGSTLEEFVDVFDAPSDMVEGVLRLNPGEMERDVVPPIAARLLSNI